MEEMIKLIIMFLIVASIQKIIHILGPVILRKIIFFFTKDLRGT